MPYYLNPNLAGIRSAKSNNDGYSISLKWNRAFPSIKTNKIAYNIYVNDELYSFERDYFRFSPSFVSADGSLNANILDLSPGQMYWFAVRAIEYTPTSFDLKTLPIINGLNSYPESLLTQNITSTSSVIHLMDTSLFPPSGTIKIGAEIIQYSSKNNTLNELLLSNVGAQRGFNGTTPAIHDTDGYDGYVYWDPKVLFFPIVQEERNTKVYECQSKVDYPNYSVTATDGYKQQLTNDINEDLNAMENANVNFPSNYFSGYHRISPVDLLRGDCVGSYIGGQLGCADGYGGAGMQIRGLNLQQFIDQREEELLSVVGEPVVLIRRQRTGIRCHCYLPSAEYPDARCNICYGSGFVLGYQQYFNPRDSTGRIMMRFDPTADNIKSIESGFDVDFLPNCWTLNTVGIQNRDFILRFDQDGNEEFRYEVLNVTRNITVLGNLGAQKMAMQRVRLTDIIYQVPIFRNTGKFPSTVTTGIASSYQIPPHSHTIVTNEGMPNQWTQISSMSQGHTHNVTLNQTTGLLEVSTEVGHTHTLF